MRSATLHAIFAVAAGAVLIGGGEHPSVAAASGETLVLEGIVTSIALAHQADSRKHWLVTISVKKVVSGKFEGRSFAFAVHSPSRAGLVRGRWCLVQAAWKDGGYVVDEVATGRLTQRIDKPDGMGPAERVRLVEEELRAYVAARQECSVDNDCARAGVRVLASDDAPPRHESAGPIQRRGVGFSPESWDGPPGT